MSEVTTRLRTEKYMTHMEKDRIEIDNLRAETQHYVGYDPQNAE